MPLLQIQQLLGHKTIGMTLRYAHLSPDFRRKAVERVCDENVVTFRTPNGKRAPLVLLQNGNYLSHFATCICARKVKDQEEKPGERRPFKLLTSDARDRGAERGLF